MFVKFYISLKFVENFNLTPTYSKPAKNRLESIFKQIDKLNLNFYFYFLCHKFLHINVI